MVIHPSPAWRAFYHQLTRPHPAVAEQDQRRTRRFIAFALITVMVLSVDLLLRLVLPHLFDAQPLHSSISIGIALGAYLLSRTRYVQVTIWLSILLTSAAMWLMLNEQSITNHPEITLIYIIMPTLFAGMFVGTRATIAIGMGQIGLALAYVMLTDVPIATSLWAQVLRLVVILSALVVALTLIRHDDEAHIARQAEAIAEREARSRHLFEAVPDALVLWNQDGIHDINPAFECLFRCDRGVIGQPAREFIEGNVQPLDDERNHFELICRRPDGTIFPAEAVRQRIMLEGREMFLTSVRDVSSQRAAQAALDQERMLLRSVIDAVPDSIYVKDTEGRFVLVNQTTVSAEGMTSSDQLIGKSDYDLRPKDRADMWAEDERRVLAGEPVINFEFVSNQGDITLLVTKIPMRDKDGTIIGLVGINRDISDLKAIEADRLALAVEQERVKILRQLIADVSHDLKTPLSSMNLSLYLLERFAHDPMKSRQHRESLVAQARRLELLIDDMLKISRLDRAAEAFTFAQADLSALVADLVTEQRPALLEDQTLTLETHAPLPPMFFDTVQLGRALSNLLVNAIRYSGAGSHIHVRIGQVDGRAQVIVADDGPGIDPADLPHIFDRFYRGDPARSSYTGGSGLGLAIAQRIVEAHGGSLTVASAPGQGTAFTLSLPLMSAPGGIQHLAPAHP